MKQLLRIDIVMKCCYGSLIFFKSFALTISEFRLFEILNFLLFSNSIAL